MLDRVQVDARDQVRAMTVGNLAMQNTTIVDGLFEALARGVGYPPVQGRSPFRWNDERLPR